MSIHSIHKNSIPLDIGTVWRWKQYCEWIVKLYHVWLAKANHALTTTLHRSIIDTEALLFFPRTSFHALYHSGILKTYILLQCYRFYVLPTRHIVIQVSEYLSSRRDWNIKTNLLEDRVPQYMCLVSTLSQRISKYVPLTEKKIISEENNKSSVLLAKPFGKSIIWQAFSSPKTHRRV